MFKPVATFILLVAFFSQTFAGPFIMLDYAVNTAKYARTCINKAKPKLHCNGKCQMMKKIQDEQKKEQQSTENKVERILMAMSATSSFCKIEPTPLVYLKKINPEIKYPLPDMSFAFFHPPQL